MRRFAIPFLLPALCAALVQGAFAQRLPEADTIYLNEEKGETPDAIDDVDNIFDDAEDISVSDEQEVKQEQVNAVTNTPDKFTLNGSLSAGAGGVRWITPDPHNSPYAALEAHCAITIRPADILTIKSDVQAKFSGQTPNSALSWTLNTLFFDYILLDKVFITVGRTATSWGSTRLFDTNILDDGKFTVNTDSSVLDSTKTVASQYLDAMVTIPLGHGHIQALMMYEPFDTESATANDLSYAAEVEYPFGPIVLNLFGRTWSDNDPAYMSPAVGIKLTSEIAKFHLTGWSEVNVRRNGWPQYAKNVISVSRVWDEPYRIGVVFEYQMTYNNLDDEDINARIADGTMQDVAMFSNAIAWTWTWRHIFGSNFAPMIQCFNDFENNCGAIIPGISWTGLPLVTISLVVPVFYGDQTNVSYNEQIVDSKSGSPTVLAGLVVRLSVSF